MAQGDIGIYASQISGHLWAPNGAYDALATITVGTAVSSVEFSGIPQGYKHLQIRATVLGSSFAADIIAQFNGVTASGNYSLHELRGNGASASAHNATSTTGFYLGTNALSTTEPAVLVSDILDYSSTSKNKTVRTLQGRDSNGSGTVSLLSSLYYGTTNAITSIKIYCSAGNFNQYSQFALYGVK